MMVVGWQRCAAGCVSPKGPRGWFWPKLEPGFGIFRVDAILCGSVPRQGAKYVHGIARGFAQVSLCAREALSIVGGEAATDLPR